MLAPRLDTVDWKTVDGPKQVTDLYLLALAVERVGRLATFDRRINAEAVTGANAGHLQLVGDD